MSGEILRQAAALMRERAEAAAIPRMHADFPIQVPISYVWTYDGNPSGAVCIEDGGVIASASSWDSEKDGGRQARYIASWHPAVALAVADALDQHAEEHGTTGRGGCGWVTCRLEMAARAYLGADQ